MSEKDEEVLAELVTKWEELREMGQDTPPVELCVDHPHLIPELTRRIKILTVTSWLDEPLPPAQGDAGAPVAWSEPGRTLAGRYRLDTLIAEGGFAQVWKGYDLELQRVVAVKVPKNHRLLSPDAFMAEARRVARLKHPGVVQVFDVGRDGEQCFIVSDFIEGGSLGEHLVNSPPTHEQTIRWMIEIAEALEHAHLHGVIHKDVKPANILIDRHGRALLADFGIAQSANRAGKQALSLGTLRYMSPEQLEGRDLDPRSDIFSLGVVLYEAVTGKVPYSSLQPNVLRREIVSGPKAVVWPEMSQPLKSACEKALSRDPANRHASAAQFAGELRKILEAPVTTNRKGFWRVLLPLVVIASIAAAGLLVSQRVTPAEPAFRFDGQHRIVTPLMRFMPVTVEVWVRPERVGGGDSPEFFVGSDRYGEYGLGIGIHQGSIHYSILKASGTPPYPLALGQWAHYAAVFSTEGTRLYLNGSHVFTAPASEIFGQVPFVIGGLGFDSRVYQFHGSIRSVRISDGERYTDLFTPQATFEPDDTTLLLYRPDHVEGDRVLDLSGRANHGRWEESLPTMPAPALPSESAVSD